jgi:hypothetical protein
MFQSWKRLWSRSSSLALQRRRPERAPRRGCRPRLEVLEDRNLPSTFMVTNTNDSGAGSLRAAITSINKDTAAVVDVIDFKIGTGGTQTINLKSELPVITHPVLIDGTSQSGYKGTPLVTLNGPSTTVADGLVFVGSSYKGTFTAEVQGLAFTNLGDSITITDTSSTPLTALVQSNTITSTKGGDALVITTGKATNTVTVSGNTITSTSAGDGIMLTGSGTTNTLTVSANSVSVQGGGDALVVQTGRSAKTTASIIGNGLHSAGQGYGLNLASGANWSVLVQGNNFTSNQVGVAVTGDGVSAGVVDLGGGSRGSTGGNVFTGFTTATADSYAIGLFGVASSYSLSAKLNTFSVSASLVIADGTHDPAAHGSGTILF